DGDAGEVALSVQAQEVVERDPAENQRVGVVAATRAGLPDPFVRLGPAAADVVAEGDEHPLRLEIEPASPPHEVGDRVHDLAVDVELELLVGGVAHADGPRAEVPAEMVQLALASRSVSVDVVEDAQAWLGESGAVQQPADEGLRLVIEAQSEESAHGQRGVAQPAVAVVPVEIAADALGEGGGGERPPRSRGPRSDAPDQRA